MPSHQEGAAHARHPAAGWGIRPSRCCFFPYAHRARHKPHTCTFHAQAIFPCLCGGTCLYSQNTRSWAACTTGFHALPAANFFPCAP